VMFGSLLTVTDADLALLLAIGAAVTVILGYIYNHLLLDSIDPVLAAVRGVRSALIEYVFVLLLTAAIVVSLKVIGALLVEAMVVVPAAAARNVARNTRGYLGSSVALALVAGVAGLFVSSRLQVPSGGAVVLALSVLFFLTLVLGSIVRSD
jgi:zinc transport system permease protein